MNDKKTSPDDPKLTAYALGELEEGERASMESLVKADPAAQAVVDEIRAFSDQLESALEGEPIQSPSVPSPPRKEAPPLKPNKVARFPYYWIAGLAAACFAVMVIFRESTPRSYEAQETKRIYEVNLRDEPAPKASVDEPSVDTTPPEITMVAGADEKKTESTLSGGAVAGPSVSAENTNSSAPSLTSTDTRSIANTSPLATASAPLPLPVDAFKPERLESVAQNLAVVPPSSPTERIVNNEAATKPTSGSVSAITSTATSGPPPSSPVIAANKPATAKSSKEEEEAIVLSPFSVSTGSSGFRGRSSLSASRLSGPGLLSRNNKSNTGTSTREPRSRSASTEAYAHQQENDFLSVRGNPLSTFSLDVDTASYANVRRFLKMGQLPPRDAVRIEELVNYFPFRYPEPSRNSMGNTSSDTSKAKRRSTLSASDDSPAFAASLEVAAAPWNPAHRLVRIGLKGRDVPEADRPPANLVFLIDVSGSMEMPNRLPLVKESLRLLLEKLKPTDRLAIVTYAGASGLALPSTVVAHKREILSALDELRAEGSANGGTGIQLAYDVAKANFLPHGINRIILCTDGDFNVGMTSEGALTRLVGEKAKTGVYLTVLGFGMGNYKDSMLEKLADRGNGNYGYIDSEAEARKLLVDQVSDTLVTVAKDVKLQIEFNPAKASAYRLIGYEDRALKKEDFNNDKVDAGEMGAGHTVTALYEVIPVGVETSIELSEEAVDPLKYQSAEKVMAADDSNKGAVSGEMLTVKIRFKPPTVEISRKVEFPLVDTGAAFAAASEDFKFAAAVAGFGMILRESPHKGSATYDNVLTWAETGQGEDSAGYRREFIELVKKAKSVSAE